MDREFNNERKKGKLQFAVWERDHMHKNGNCVSMCEQRRSKLLKTW